MKKQIVPLYTKIPHEIDAETGTNHQEISILFNGESDGILVLEQTRDVICFSRNQLAQLRNMLNLLGDI